MRNFKELEIWTIGMQIVKLVYGVSNQLPNHEKFGLISQITKAAVSIPSNIAEGCAKSSEKEFKLYLERSLGSAFELETQLLIISDLQIVVANELQNIIIEVQSEQRMLGSFISKVKNRLSKTKFLNPNTQNL